MPHISSPQTHVHLEGMWLHGPGYVAMSKALLLPPGLLSQEQRQHCCITFGMPPSTDIYFHLSYSFASLLPPWGRWRWQRGRNRPELAVLFLHPSVCPMGFSCCCHCTAQLSCTLRLAQRMLLALFYSLLHQEHTWDKLEQAGIKGLLWATFPFLSRSRAHGRAQVGYYIC